MREIADDVARWLSAGQTDIAIATVLKTFGSAPRKEGAKLAYLVNGSRVDVGAAADNEQPVGRLSGSISGGCVESSIIDEAVEAVRTRVPKIVHYDTTDDEAWEVGLPCGGGIDVLVEPIDIAAFHACRELVRRNERVVQITILPPAADGPANGRVPHGKLVVGVSGQSSGNFPPALILAAVELAARSKRNGRVTLADGVEVFVDIIPPVPTLVAVGGVHTAMAMVKMAHVLGFKTVVVDPRQTFGTTDRFPDVDRLTTKWPQAAFSDTPLTADTAIVMLTHDPKLDDPALDAALRSDAFYIGALGSARTQERRRKRLRERGFDEQALSRIHGPVGLDIGSSTPEQIALSILAEIVAVMNDRDGDIQQKRNVDVQVPGVRPVG